MKAKLPILAIERLMREKGAQRVSDDAKEELREILEVYLSNLSVKASKITLHANRKTITKGDLFIARE
ncbi:MAG: NFYB/HAP3 family transcription factor subunit [Candidatus Woesearchaeota archaeon]|nr:NFYB/HAP3 family transcription factor subunit [Nanoarchaeota archaeon]USN44277.1 MAG: NFYB/HAP3 family transcription factor subunit [Candidatus Woesearchaeota archaeon]